MKRNPMRPFEEFVEVARAQEPHCQYRQRRCYLDGISIAKDPVGRNGRITGIRCFFCRNDGFLRYFRKNDGKMSGLR